MLDAFASIVCLFFGGWAERLLQQHGFRCLGEVTPVQSMDISYKHGTCCVPSVALAIN